MVNIITEFPEVTEMADGIGLEYIGIFWGAGNIINSNGREIQIWSNTINWKGIVE